MAITAADLKFYYSGGNTGSPASSLGGSPSTTEITGGLHNLFDIVSSAEATSGENEFRCFYVKNENISSLSLLNTKFWISTDSTGPSSDIEIGLGGSPNVMATTVANENTSPAGVTFVATATSEGAALNIGTLAATQVQSIWIKRIVPVSAAAANGIGSTFTIKGDTGA